MYRRSCAIGIAVLSLLTACEKEIDMDYRSVAPLYVVEGTVNQTGTVVRMRTTRNVDSNDRDGTVVENALMVLTSSMGALDTLENLGKGKYVSRIYGIPGLTYQLDIDVDGHHFTSTSTMLQEPQLNSFRFVWRKVVTEDMLFGDLRIQDVPNENNYYFFHMYRNNIGYRWAVMRDTKNPGGEIQQLFNCTTRSNMDKDNDEDVLHEGDYIHVEIRSIDKLAYDYFYSMQQMSSTGTNPIDNFTGGCLGYFSAYALLTYDCVFHRNDIETEEE